MFPETNRIQPSVTPGVRGDYFPTIGKEKMPEIQKGWGGDVKKINLPIEKGGKINKINQK